MAATGDNIVEVMKQAMRLIGAGEAMLGVMSHIGPSVETLTRIVERDPDMIPELQAAVDALGECSDALARAMRFVNARYEVAHEQMVKGVGDAEA